MAEKEQFQIEFLIKSSQNVLYNRLSTPGGLAEWFADDVHIKSEIFTFYWDGAPEQAKLLSKKPQESIRFQWLDDSGTDCYFEFRLRKDPLTNDIALIITDFTEPDEIDSARSLWESQVGDLMHMLGS